MSEPRDPEQLALDNEDLRARLKRVRQAVITRDEAEMEVRHLQLSLKQARRRLKEAIWELSNAAAWERQHPTT